MTSEERQACLCKCKICGWWWFKRAVDVTPKRCAKCLEQARALLAAAHDAGFRYAAMFEGRLIFSNDQQRRYETAYCTEVEMYPQDVKLLARVLREREAKP